MWGLDSTPPLPVPLPLSHRAATQATTTRMVYECFFLFKFLFPLENSRTVNTNYFIN